MQTCPHCENMAAGMKETRSMLEHLVAEMAATRTVVEGMQKIRPGASVKVAPFNPGRKADAEPGNMARPAEKAN